MARLPADCSTNSRSSPAGGRAACGTWRCCPPPRWCGCPRAARDPREGAGRCSRSWGVLEVVGRPGRRCEIRSLPQDPPFGQSSSSGRGSAAVAPVHWPAKPPRSPRRLPGTSQVRSGWLIHPPRPTGALMHPLILLADVVAITVLTFGIYYPRHRRRDMVTAYLGVNAGVLAVAATLATVQVGVGLGLGLFGVLSIIRLRSAELDQAAVAYYFGALALGLLGGLGLTDPALTVGLMGLIVAALFVGDHPRLLATGPHAGHPPRPGLPRRDRADRASRAVARRARPPRGGAPARPGRRHHAGRGALRCRPHAHPRAARRARPHRQAVAPPTWPSHRARWSDMRTELAPTNRATAWRTAPAPPVGGASRAEARRPLPRQPHSRSRHRARWSRCPQRRRGLDTTSTSAAAQHRPGHPGRARRAADPPGPQVPGGSRGRAPAGRSTVVAGRRHRGARAGRPPAVRLRVRLLRHAYPHQLPAGGTTAAPSLQGSEPLVPRLRAVLPRGEDPRRSPADGRRAGSTGHGRATAGDWRWTRSNCPSSPVTCRAACRHPRRSRGR